MAGANMLNEHAPKITIVDLVEAITRIAHAMLMPALMQLWIWLF